LVKKLLNPLVVSAFILVLVFGSIMHLCYGHLQTTKYHYIFQHHFAVRYLPEWLHPSLGEKRFVGFDIYKNYSGLWQSWHRNGELSYKGEWLNGKPIGDHQVWSEKKIRLISGKWLNGNAEGLHQNWYLDGAKMLVYNYVNGKANGDQTVWDKFGNKRRVSKYVNGVQHGKEVSWFEDGSVASTGEWVNGAGVNSHKGFYKDGKLEEYKEFLDGIVVYLEEWNEVGTLSQKEYFKDNGDFEKRELFEKDKLIKTETEE